MRKITLVEWAYFNAKKITLAIFRSELLVHLITSVTNQYMRFPVSLLKGYVYFGSVAQWCAHFLVRLLSDTYISRFTHIYILHLTDFVAKILGTSVNKHQTLPGAYYIDVGTYKHCLRVLDQIPPCLSRHIL